MQMGFMTISSLRTAVTTVAAVVALGVGAAFVLEAAQGPPDVRMTRELSSDQVVVEPVRDNIYLLVPDGGANVTAQIGRDGVVLVDTPPAALMEQVRGVLGRLTNEPISYVINTSLDADHIGSNQGLARPPGYAPQGRGFNRAPATALGGPSAVPILAHENVLNRMARGDYASGSLPTVEYFQPTKDFSMNGEAIIVYHAPAAHSDGDSIVMFRGSDVISTGDVYTPDRYPVIDLAVGGSVAGLIAALNHILSLTVPQAFQEGGTTVVPGHGRLSEEADVVEYRDMVVIIRDRIRASMDDGMSLEEIQDSRPSFDYDREYQSTEGPTPEQFVATIYQSLSDSR